MMNRSKCGVAVYLNQEKGNEKLNVYGQSVFPYTPATNLLYGLKEVLILLKEEGLDQVFTPPPTGGSNTESGSGL